MGRQRDLSSEKRAQIEVLSKEGLSQRSIATRLKVSQSAVSRTLTRLSEKGDYDSRRRCGRPTITSLHGDRAIRRAAVANPFISSGEVRANLAPVIPNISARTIRRRLSDKFGLKSHKPSRKPFLTAKNRRDRLAFCRQYRNWTAEQWKTVMFSDETKVSQFRSYRPSVRRPQGQRYNERYVVKSVRSTPSVMIWGAITASGRCGLHFVPKNTTIKGADYLAIIQERVPRFMTMRGTTILQQDGAPCHNAKIVKDWITASNFELLQGWPGNSPDLNPIENCWVMVKRLLQAHNCTSYNDLVEKTKAVWVQEITAEYCRGLVESMPARIEACLKNNGGPTKY